MLLTVLASRKAATAQAAGEAPCILHAVYLYGLQVQVNLTCAPSFPATPTIA